LETVINTGISGDLKTAKSDKLNGKSDKLNGFLMNEKRQIEWWGDIFFYMSLFSIIFAEISKPKQIKQ